MVMAKQNNYFRFWYSKSIVENKYINILSQNEQIETKPEVMEMCVFCMRIGYTTAYEPL